MWFFFLRHKLKRWPTFMIPIKNKGFACLFAGATLSAVAVNIARAGGPLPFDAATPVPNTSAVLLYNQFSSASSAYSASGVKIGHTRIQTDVPVLRFVHSFGSIDKVALFGVQVIAPYVTFLGNQEEGGRMLTHSSGFAEPQLSVFGKFLNNPKEDQTLTLTYFMSPPSGSYNPAYALNGSSNTWVNNIEAGFVHLLAGSATKHRLDLQVWGDMYFYGENNNTRIATARGELTASTHIEPVEQLIVYLPYYFHPKTAGYVGLSFEQTFGGKQYLTAPPLGSRRFDTGTRNNFTRIGVVAGSFIAPTMFLQGEVSTDVRVRGGVRNDIFAEIQIARIF